MKTKTQKPAKMRKKRAGDLVLYVSVVSYFTAMFLVFQVYINFNTILLLFQRYDPESGGINYVWASPFYANFKRFIDEFFLDNNTTLRQSLVRGPISYIVSFAIGFIPGIVGPYYIHKKMPAGRLFKILFFLPGILGTAVLVIMYTNTVEVFIPALVKAVSGKEIAGFFSNPDSIFITLLAYGIWLGAGAGSILYIGTMNTIPSSLSEAMQLDGANDVKEIIHLAFPTIFPVMSIGIWMGIPGLFTGTLPVYAFFGPYAKPEIYTLGYYIQYRVLLGGSFDYPYVSTMNTIISVVSLPFIFTARYLLERFGPSQD